MAIMKRLDQIERDRQRVTYRLAFPSDLDPERVTAWLRSLSGTLRASHMNRIFTGIPTIVMELWATHDGIEHRLKVPWAYEPYIRPKLESLVPGIRLIKEDEYPTRVWTYAIEAGLKHGHRPLRIPNPTDVSTSILSNFGTMDDDETLLLQWVISPAVPEHPPIHGEATSRENRWRTILTGSTATKDEVSDRRDKLDEPNMMGVLRVAAFASTPVRAQFMVRGVMSTLEATRGPAHQFYKRIVGGNELQKRITIGMSTVTMPVQVSAPELTALSGWPLGEGIHQGMPAPASRYLPAPNSVPTNGIVLGASNYPGRERKIAVSFKDALTHLHVCGPSGVGKTVLLANMFKQIVDAGHGAIVIQVAGDLFQKTLDYIPAHRIDDVIVFDVNDTSMPVGWNFLREGPPEVVVDEVLNIFKHLYRDHPSMWASQALYHGLHTLAADKDATFIDLLSLVSPTKDEVDWSHRLRNQVTDPQLVRYWQDLENSGIVKQEAKMEPLASRVWPMSRSKLVNIVGQSRSSFSMDEVVRGNKILLVNLAGVEREAAALMATLLVNSLWNTVKRFPMPDKPNYLIADEAQHMMDLPIDLQDMLVEARKFGLSITAAHQHLGQLPHEMKYALMHSAPTKVVFQTGADDAREFPHVMGSEITDHDFMHLNKYEAVARIATAAGVSRPLTLTTAEPAKGYGNASRVIYTSRGKYGRPVKNVQEEIVARRTAEQGTHRKRQPPKVSDWGI